MEITGVTMEHIKVAFTLTESEVDDISIALSLCTISAKDDKERHARDTLQGFSTMLNDMLQRVEEAHASHK